MSRKDKPSKSAYGFAKKCPYCGANVVLRDSHFVYHNNKNYGKMWVCSNFPQCDSYVGCHPGTDIPLGRLADSVLRRGFLLCSMDSQTVFFFHSPKVKQRHLDWWLLMIGLLG